MVTDAITAVVRRFRHALFSMISVAVGILAVVTTLGLSQSASDNITATLRDVEGHQVVLRMPPRAWEIPETELLTRLHQLPQVQQVGTFTPLEARTSTSVEVRSLRGRADTPRFVVATAAGLHAQGVVVRHGDLSGLAADRGDVIAVGPQVARALRSDPGEGHDRIDIGPLSARLGAIIEDSGPRSMLSTSIVLSPSLAGRLGLLERGQRSLIVLSDLNHREADLKLAADPARPEDVTVTIPAALRGVTARIDADTTALILTLAGVSLLASGMGVATTMLAAVWERRSEIGVRRALGASRVRIAGQFMTEGMILTTIGSALGWTLGVLITAALARHHGWVLGFPPWVFALPVLGPLVGVVFGAYPAWRAAQVEPAELLRSL
ncbi:hypothetical protein KEM60_00671 [Austwickia sp. TVS 96-490-7B]|uniref:ABC transporter permease n=1 Tax=Austwickia sp. TVS 96-490-7B TaxID=2830843 RepID=UPI001C56A651|nr:FtsX-like permease family protein [Austwickia sp. TVS 96-490-7B]MBW3084483.1 hypothetical protein [Austwickia sp. TVS 96-490-7B]